MRYFYSSNPQRQSLKERMQLSNSRRQSLMRRKHYCRKKTYRTCNLDMDCLYGVEQAIAAAELR